MSILNALASVAVSDLNIALQWYENVLGKAPDARPMPEVAEGEPLGLEPFDVVVARNACHEVDERVLRVPAVDGERRDAGSGDHGEGEERLTNDVAKGLKTADAFTNPLEPTVRTDGVEGENALLRHEGVSAGSHGDA